MIPFPLLAALLLGAAGPALPLELPFVDDAGALVDRWEEQALRGHTTWRAVVDSTGAWAEGEAEDAASALYHVFREPLEARGLELAWTWEALEFPAGEDLTEKRGDDRAAAVAVVFNRSRIPFLARAIFYVWSSVHEPGTLLRSPYASGVGVIVLRRGPGEGALEERRRVDVDYRRLFGESPPAVEAVGVLTDSDDTGTRSRGRYGPLRLERAGGLPAPR